MRTPRDLAGADLAKSLGRVGHRVTRQRGSHIRLTAEQPPQHHITISAHAPLKIGILAAILDDVAVNVKLNRDELLQRLFG